jgi:hypothetical protein
MLYAWQENWQRRLKVSVGLGLGLALGMALAREVSSLGGFVDFFLIAAGTAFAFLMVLDAAVEFALFGLLALLELFDGRGGEE